MTEDVLIRSEGAAGRITLNRPKALNALNFAMTEAITAALSEWRNDESVKHVIIEGAGGRAFCAGGDIRALYDIIPTDPDYPRAFWRAEYRLNALIARFEKPYVALMDGFCLGGGVGLSAHGSHRIVTERSMVGMPETAIGFTPDVGGSWLLARAPGHAGEYMAATAYRMNAADAIHAGFADIAIRADDIPALVAALLEGRDAGQTAQRFATDPGSSDLAARRADIDLIFGTETIQEAVRRLEAKHGTWAEAALRKIRTHSPTALAAAHYSVRMARGYSKVEESLDHEYRYAYRCVDLHDFREGVRALLVDKDGRPQWRPAELDDVRLGDVVELFAPLGKNELGLMCGRASS